MAADDLTGLMMDDAPLIVFADKQIARGQRAAVELFLAQYQGDIAVKEYLFIEAGDAWGVRVRQNPLQLIMISFRSLGAVHPG